jgi:hypothetical protein
MGRRLLASGAVGLLLLAALAGVVVLGGPTGELSGAAPEDPVTVAVDGLELRLNDEIDLPSTNGSVETCVASGTPGDSVSLLGDVLVTIPPDRLPAVGESDPRVVFTLEALDTTRRDRIDPAGTTGVDLFWILNDDETLSVGAETTLTIRVETADGEPLRETTRTLTVREGERTYDC